MRVLLLLTLFVTVHVHVDGTSAKMKKIIERLVKSVGKMQMRIINIEEDVKEIKSLPVFNATKVSLTSSKLPSMSNRNSHFGRGSKDRNRSRHRGYRRTYHYETTTMPMSSPLPGKRTRNRSLNKHRRNGDTRTMERMSTPYPMFSSSPWEGSNMWMESTSEPQVADRSLPRNRNRPVLSRSSVRHLNPRRKMASQVFRNNTRLRPMDIARHMAMMTGRGRFDSGNFSSSSNDTHNKRIMEGMMNGMFQHLLGGQGQQNQETLDNHTSQRTFFSPRQRNFRAPSRRGQPSTLSGNGSFGRQRMSSPRRNGHGQNITTNMMSHSFQQIFRLGRAVSGHGRGRGGQTGARRGQVGARGGHTGARGGQQGAWAGQPGATGGFTDARRGQQGAWAGQPGATGGHTEDSMMNTFFK